MPTESRALHGSPSIAPSAHSRPAVPVASGTCLRRWRTCPDGTSRRSASTAYETPPVSAAESHARCGSPCIPELSYFRSPRPCHARHQDTGPAPRHDMFRTCSECSADTPPIAGHPWEKSRAGFHDSSDMRPDAQPHERCLSAPLPGPHGRSRNWTGSGWSGCGKPFTELWQSVQLSPE